MNTPLCVSIRRITPVLSRCSFPQIILLTLSLLTSVASAQQLEWMRRFGSVGHGDTAADVATDASGVYVIGSSSGPFPGQTAVPGVELYVRKYSFQGTVLWTRHYGVGSGSSLTAIANDANGIYVAGIAEMPQFSAFVSRLDLSGNVVWTHVFSYQRMNRAMSIAVHRRGIYVGGNAGVVNADAILAKLDFNGNEVWITPPGIGTTSYDQFTGVTVDDSGVYGVGFIGAADIRKFDFNGNEIAQFGKGDFSGSISLRGKVIAHDSTGIYAVGYKGDVLNYSYQIIKYSRSGVLLWQKALLIEAGAVLTDSGGVYLVTPNLYGEQPHVAKYTRNGDFVWEGGFGQLLLSSGGAVHDGAVYLAGVAFGATEDDADSFVAKYVATRPPQLLSLGLVDGAPLIDTLVHDPVVARVVSTTRNALTGAQFSTFDFSPQYHPQDLLVLPDRNGNAAPKQALLGVDETKGNVVAEIRDSRSGTLLNAIAFDKTYVPRRLAVLPNIGSNHPGLAVLGDSTVDGSLRVEIKDSVTGAAVQMVGFDRWPYNEPFTDFRIIPDANRNGSSDIVVLFPTLNFERGSRAVVKDALTGADISAFTYDDHYCPRDIVVMPDLNGNGSAELATLLQGCWPGWDGVRVSIHDTRTGIKLSDVWYSKYERPVALVLVPDLNGNGRPDLGVMALSVIAGKDVFSIKDPITKLAIRDIVFQRDGYKHRGIALIPDTNGNHNLDVAQLQENKLDGSLRVLIKDVGTGTFIRYLR